jgi:hypothetical protein
MNNSLVFKNRQQRFYVLFSGVFGEGREIKEKKIYEKEARPPSLPQ